MGKMKPIAAGRAPELVQLDAVAKPGPPAEMIFSDWYPALRADKLKRGDTALSTLLGIPMLVGRKADGAMFAMRDLCPHRGIPLSAGWFDGETVQCKYHGWRFEPCSGRCEEIPSLTSHDNLVPQKIYANSFPVRERDGYAWVYVPPAGAGRVVEEDVLPPVPELPKFGERYRSAHLQADLPCNVDHGIIGLMDPAHGPFVHQAWWWRSAASIHEKTKKFEPILDEEHDGFNAGFRMSPHAPSSNSAPYKLLGKPVTTIDFVLPNRRYETIVADKNGKRRWFSSITTVTPVTPSTCRIDVLAAWNIGYFVPGVTPLVRFFGARFVGQDQQTMVEQARGLRSNPGLMLIDDADKPAKWYFALKQRRLTGKGEHPLQVPVELHWRS
ncbi:MAG TPA: Rieske (2Fe-2S) protein [Acidobacteriaceae bacterium]|jgi:phenylpropionate dioxygenase-like ring-hydroxylating dioxygenase large terminal subunit